MRVFPLAPLALFALSCTAEPAAGQTISVLKATAVESHGGLTVFAQPWPSPAQYKATFGKRSPFGVGILGVKMAFRNDLSENVVVNLDRILLLATLPDGTRLQLAPLRAEEVADAVLNPGTRYFPGMKKPPKTKAAGWRDKHWWEVQRRVQDASFSSGLVAPHNISRGLIFFDVQGQFNALNSAHLYIPELRTTGRNQPLMYFEIDLSTPTTPGT
jgi:hypothetical protein